MWFCHSQCTEATAKSHMLSDSDTLAKLYRFSRSYDIAPSLCLDAIDDVLVQSICPLLPGYVRDIISTIPATSFSGLLRSSDDAVVIHKRSTYALSTLCLRITPHSVNGG